MSGGERPDPRARLREAVLLAGLTVYAAVLAFGALGALFHVDWILRFF